MEAMLPPLTNACCCTTASSSQRFNSMPLLQPTKGGDGGATATPPRLDKASSARGLRPPLPLATRHLWLHMRRRMCCGVGSRDVEVEHLQIDG